MSAFNIQVGHWYGECPRCKQAGLVMRIGREKITCRCEGCRKTFQAPKRKPKKKKSARPTFRTYAGLRGQKIGKGRRSEWHFTYRTKYAPLLLRAKKFMGDWDVYYDSLRMGSGNTLVEALEQAKRKMANRGHELVV